MNTAILCTAVGLWACLVPALSAAPTAMATKATGTVKLDGILNEADWARAGWCTGFVRADGDQAPDAPFKRAAVETRFKVLVDDTAVYVGVECDEPLIDKLKAATPWRDGAVWADDCVEIFFDPAGTGRFYHQVMVNARGTIYDSYSADYGLVHSRLWNGAFRAAGHIDREARKWTAEVEIPFGAVVLTGDAKSAWRWNVARERHATGRLELSSWSPLRGNFHLPDRFGTLTGLPGNYAAFQLRIGEPSVSVSRSGSGVVTLSMALAVRNETDADRRIAGTAAVFEDEQRRVETGPVALPGGQSVALAFPPLRLRASVSRTNVVFSIREAGTGKLIKAVVKDLQSEYRPIAVEVLRPCYRDTIYATETLDEIVFQVSLSAQVRQACTKVAYALTHDPGRVVARGETPTAETDKPTRIKAANLGVGTYTLQVTALGAGDKAEASTTVTIRKLAPPPAGNEVRIDEHRNILVNGKPVFCIGWYGRVTTEDPRPDVVALQNVQTPVVLKVPDATPVRDAFRKHGVYSVVSVENGRLFYSFNLWQKGKEKLRGITKEQHTRTEPSDDLKRLARELVESVRGEPGLLGYYIADEPEIHDIPSAYLESYYRYLRELDPYHPVFVTNDTIDGIVTHGCRCADVLDPDPYSPAWDYVPNFLKKINEVASRGKATYVTLWHSSSQAHFNKPYGSSPPYPYRVLRNQYFASIAYGAKGFTPYTSAFFLEEIEHRYGLPPIWRELRLLEPAILAPAPVHGPTVEGAADLACWSRQVGAHVYLVLVHHKNGSRRATVRWAALGVRDKLYVMSEGRDVAVRDGAFTDRFAEGDVHVYTDDPKARALPTVEAVMAELARRHREAAKPGNLLHWTRGTRMHASEGYYAPWFSQYYYYAINGLTDDKGWSAYAWGNKPAWIELVLNEPADVGRIVIYTPNLRDYQLDFTDADGHQRRVSVTGSDKDVITHNLRPAVPCLKLRLTATAVRSCKRAGGKAPLVSEIEAYADASPGPVTAVRDAEVRSQAPGPSRFSQDKGPNTLWSEDFADFQTAPQYDWKGQDTKWVLNPAEFRAQARPGGGVAVASISSRGYAGMSHIFAYDPAYRFFQVKLGAIDGKGYRFTYVGFGHSSGRKGYRGAINTARPGIYTVDTHYIHGNFRTGKDKTCFVVVSTAGSNKRPDGGVEPGPTFTFDWLHLVRRPLDGLTVARPDGSPLADAVKAGDTLRFELLLEKPAKDAVVEVFFGPAYQRIPINGQPYVQLRRADDVGCVWTGEVTLGSGTGKADVKGYPTIFKARITGGAISETNASAFVSSK